MTKEGKEIKNEKNEKNDETRMYEIGYLLVPTIVDGEVGGVAAGLKDIIREHGGIILSEGEPKSKNLAYQMSKSVGHGKKRYETAYFGWFLLTLPVENARAVITLFENNESVIRMIMFKTTKEDAMPKKKIPSVRKKKTTREQADSGKSSVVEIDKAIEEMITD